MTPTYRKLQQRILELEGKTLEDELGFGCGVRIKPNVNPPTEGVQVIVGHEHELYRIVSEKTGKSFGTWVSPVHFEILGLPITLLRILKALGKNGHGGHFILPSGDIARFTNNLYQDKWEVVCTWNLDHPADQQHQEVQEKLITLLS